MDSHFLTPSPESGCSSDWSVPSDDDHWPENEDSDSDSSEPDRDEPSDLGLALYAHEPVPSKDAGSTDYKDNLSGDGENEDDDAPRREDLSSWLVTIKMIHKLITVFIFKSQIIISDQHLYIMVLRRRQHDNPVTCS